jgi:hypothetical protein
MTETWFLTALWLGLPVLNYKVIEVFTSEDARWHGILARVDVFRTITTESPDWKAIQAQKIVLADAKTVRDIMRRDTHK